MMAKLSLTGVFMGTEFDKEPVYAAVAELLAQAARGEIEVVVDSTFPLSAAAKVKSSAGWCFSRSRACLVTVGPTTLHLQS